VMIEADRDVKFQHVVTVMDAVKRIGVDFELTDLAVPGPERDIPCPVRIASPVPDRIALI